MITYSSTRQNRGLAKRVYLTTEKEEAYRFADFIGGGSFVHETLPDLWYIYVPTDDNEQ